MHTSRTTSSATLVDAPVVDGDLGGRAGVQCVEQFRIVQEHGGLVILAGDGIVDVGEGKTFGKLVPHLKNPIRPDAADGDGVLHRMGDAERFLFGFYCFEKGFDDRHFSFSGKFYRLFFFPSR